MLATIVQARMGSTRLPGKVLKTVGGKTILEHVIARIHMCHQDTGRLVVAIPAHSTDDPIAELCAAVDVDCYRSSEHDVLNRYYQAAASIGATRVLRVTADEPLLCPDLTDAILSFEDPLADYVTFRDVPLGLTGELVTMDALTRCWTMARDPAEREHVTLHAINRPASFSLAYLEPGDWLYDRKHWRLTLDTPEDLKLLQRLYDLTEGQLFTLDTGAVCEAVERDKAALSLATRRP